MVRVPYVAERPPHVFQRLHAIERGVQRIGCDTYCIDHRVPRSLGIDSGVLPCRACCLAGPARLFAGDACDLSVVSPALLLLSDGFERVAMMIADLTRFLGELPGLFRVVPGRFSGHGASR